MNVSIIGASMLLGISALAPTSTTNRLQTSFGEQAVRTAAAPAVGRANTTGDENIVIYRRKAQPGIFATTVKVDGRKVASLNNGEYTTTRLTPGRHRVTLGWSLLSGQKGGAIEVEIGSGQSVTYLEVLGTSEFAGMGYGYMRYRMGSGMVELDAAAGSKAVALCCELKAGR